MVFNIGFYIIEAGASKRLRHNESSENYIVDSDYNTILKITFLRSYFSTINKSSRSQRSSLKYFFLKVCRPANLSRLQHRYCKIFKIRFFYRIPLVIASEWSGKKEQKAKTNLLMTQQPIVIIKTTSTTTAPPIAAPIIIVLSLVFVVVDVGCTNWRTVITSELSEFLIILVDPSTPPIIDSVLVNLSGSSGLVGYNTVYKTCTSPVPSSFGKPSTMMIWSLVNTRGLDLRFLNNQLQK